MHEVWATILVVLIVTLWGVAFIVGMGVGESRQRRRRNDA